MIQDSVSEVESEPFYSNPNTRREQAEPLLSSPKFIRSKPIPMVKLLNVAGLLVSCVGLVSTAPVETVTWSLWNNWEPNVQPGSHVSTTVTRFTAPILP
jgi:hypothetical protein